MVKGKVNETMTAAIEERLSLESLREAFEKKHKQNSPLAQYAEEAFKKFIELGFPTSHLEEWKYINLDPLLKAQLKVGTNVDAKVDSELIAQNTFEESKAQTIVFLNGVFSATHSNVSALPKELIFAPLGQAYADCKNTIDVLLDEMSNSNDPFTLLNASFAPDAYVLYLPKGLEMKAPLHLSFLTTGNARCMNHSKVFVICESFAKLDLIVTFNGESKTTYLTNYFADFVLQPESKVNVTFIQNESHSAFQMAQSRLKVGRNAELNLHNFSLGGHLSRHRMEVDLQEPGATANLNGLYVLSDNNSSHNQLVINHQQANTYSSQLFKGILDDESHAEFSGTINVAKKALGTDAKQLNRNLLLSSKAKIDSRPQLQIEADDVKCSHGATIGQLAEEQIFYLLSRGIEKKKARQILTYGFAEEIIEKVLHKSLRQKLDELFLANIHSTSNIIEKTANS